MISFQDIEDDKFLVTWNLKDTASTGYELLPRKRIHFGNLIFDVEDNEERVNLEFSGPDSLNVHFDYSKHEVIPFEYVATSTRMRHFAVDLLPPVITNLHPDRTLEVADTLQIVGKNFGDSGTVKLYGKSETGYFRFRKVDNDNILHHSDTLITLLIPPFLENDHDEKIANSWRPTSGKVIFHKNYSRSHLSVTSEESIKIE